jgi:hypothetical protein
LKISKFLLNIAMFFTLGGISGCGVYSFSGVAISAETLTINNFFNDALGGPPDLAQRFTNSLQDYFQRNTSLTLVPENGDILIEGVVTSYTLTHLGSTQETVNNQQVETAADTKLTISVKVSYVNVQDDQFNFESKTFTQFEPFSNEQNFTAIEDQLLETIYDKLILDIFNSTVANW